MVFIRLFSTEAIRFAKNSGIAIVNGRIPTVYRIVLIKAVLRTDSVTNI
jgi:hypothetical protein